MVKIKKIAPSLVQLDFFWQRILGANLSWASFRVHPKSFHFPPLPPKPNMSLQSSLLLKLFGSVDAHAE